MPAPKSNVIASFIMIGLAISLAPSAARAAKMTQEQARNECRNEIPRVGRGDAGNSRGSASTANPIRDCIKAKMSGR
jgi:hypothetical protein